MFDEEKYMRKKVSVIVPVYNTEKYLKRCIDSIVNQTYANLEIILVDDGSTDNSQNICKEYAQADKRICVISGENYGVSHARNEGMRKATGDFLYFVDSDDLLSINAIDTMVKEFEKVDCELVIAGYSEMENDEKAVKKSWGKLTLTSNDAKKSVLDESGAGGYLWNKLFIASLIKENDIKFDEQICVWEDVLFVMEYIDKCKKVDLIDDIVYVYCRRYGSAIEYSRYSSRLYTQLDAITKIKTLVDLDEPTEELLEYRKARCCLGLIRSMGIGKNIDRNQLRTIRLKMDDIPRKIVRNKLSTIDKASWFLIKMHPELFARFYGMAKRIF